MNRALLVVLALAACAPKAPLPADRSAIPAPLAARPFTAPAITRATLSNGLTVVVAENHEAPLAWARLAFRGGGHADPPGKEGLASVTMDMLNEGAGEYDAVGLSAALKRLGSDLGSSATDDGASLGISGLTRNLGPTLDLMVKVLRETTFPQSEWDLLKKQRIADLDRKRKDPEWISARVFDRILLGDTYRGRAASKASYEAITTDDMRAWWAANLTPDNAILLVGGDVTLETLVPELEARFASWKGSGASSKPVEVPPPALPPGPAPIHVVDRPGAAQSVLRVGGYVSDPGEESWFPLLLANQAVGGQFTARLNMNLREEKGWTYGARSSLGYDLAGGRLVASAGVRTDVTGPALSETLSELSGPASRRPLTAAELEDGRSSVVLGWPLRFESPDFQLGQEESVWRYGLPSDWVSGYVSRLNTPTLEQAASAWNTSVPIDRLVIVVVGDVAKIRPDLEKLGRPIVELDADGAPVATSSP